MTGIMSMFPDLVKQTLATCKKDNNGNYLLDDGTSPQKMTPAQIVSRIQNGVVELDRLSGMIEKAVKAGKDAAQAARAAKGNKATFGLFEGKEKAQKVIQGMQAADDAQAAAIESLSEAQQAQFNFQKDIAQILKGLFILGCGSLAMNRMVVREVQMQLSGASQGKINELAQRELMSLIDQLNEQRDILEKQEQLGKNQKEQAEQLATTVKGVEANRSAIESQQQKIASNVSRIERNRTAIESQSRQVATNAEGVRQNQEAIKNNKSRLEENFEADKRRDEEISSLRKDVDELRRIVATPKTSMLPWVAIAISLMAIVLSGYAVFH